MASLPSTYQAVVLKEAKQPFTLSTLPLKKPTGNQILVKILACGVCFSDYDLSLGHFGPVFPVVPGHEIVGDVVAVGPEVKAFKGGERVGGPWHGGHDGACRQCQRAQFQMCDNKQINGVSQDGGYAEYVLLRAEAAVRVPKELDPAQTAPLLCAGVTVFNALRKTKTEQGNLVAVQGLGGLGHLAVQYARNMGYEVAVLSSGDDKAAFAKELGAHHYINSKTKDVAEELTKLGGAAVIMQTAPSPKAFQGLVGGLQAGGTVLSLSPVGSVEIDTLALLNKGATLMGWPSGHALDSEEAIRFASTHGIKCMINTYPLKDVQQAVDDLAAGKPRFRNVLVMQ